MVFLEGKVKNSSTFIGFWFTIFGIVLVSCSPSSKKAKYEIEEGIYNVDISASAGDDYEIKTESDTIKFTPYPFNYGFINTKDDLRIPCVIISNRIDRNRSVKSKPIGLLNYQENSTSRKLVIAVPVSNDDKVIEVDNFMDLATKYPSVKNIIQDWTLSKCGLGCAKFESWGDDNAAGLYIQKQSS